MPMVEGVINAQRHRCDIGASCSLSQTDGEPRIDKIAYTNTNSRAGDHACQNDVCRIVESESEDRAEKYQRPDIVEKQGEKSGCLSPENYVD